MTSRMSHRRRKGQDREDTHSPRCLVLTHSSFPEEATKGSRAISNTRKSSGQLVGGNRYNRLFFLLLLVNQIQIVIIFSRPSRYISRPPAINSQHTIGNDDDGRDLSLSSSSTGNAELRGNELPEIIPYTTGIFGGRGRRLHGRLRSDPRSLVAVSCLPSPCLLKAIGVPLGLWVNGLFFCLPKSFEIPRRCSRA